MENALTCLTPSGVVSGKKTINHSLICALTTEGIIHYEIRTGSVNGDIFKKFIEDTINKLPSPGYCFIFDNVSFHHNKEMIKMIEMRGHTCFHTPPYSPLWVGPTPLGVGAT